MISKYAVEVGFMGGEQNNKVLYTKGYIVKAESKEQAGIAVYNGLSMQEYHNFRVLKTEEIENEC